MAQERNGTELHLARTWAVILARRWTIVAVTGVLLVLAVVGTLFSTSYYRATATLQIEPKAPVVFDVGSVSDAAPAYPWGPALPAYYQTQYELLRSRAVREEAVRILREEHAIDDFDDVKNPQAWLGGFVQIIPRTDTQLVDIRVEYPDPEKAALFANATARAFLDLRQQRTTEESDRALEWLRTQLAVYKDRKAESDEALHRFRYENQLGGTDAGEHQTARSLTLLREDLAVTHARRLKAEARYESLLEARHERGGMALAVHLGESDPTLRELLSALQAASQEGIRVGARYMEKHPDVVRNAQEQEGLRRQVLDHVDLIIESQRTTTEMLQRDEGVLEAEVARVEVEYGNLAESFVEWEMLRGEAERNATFYRDLDRRLTEVGISRFLRTSNAHIAQYAVANPSRVRPSLPNSLLGALLMGLFGGVTLAIALEYLDLTIKTPEDLDGIGLPYLGLVPQVKEDQLRAAAGDSHPRLVVHSLPRSPAAESFRTLRTTIMLALGKGPKRILVTSGAPQEGKSFTAANLALVFAAGSERVLLLDGDLRRPTIHTLFGVRNQLGMHDILRGEATLAECILRDVYPGLDILPAGQPNPDLVQLLESSRVEAILDSLAGYDHIVIDSPPVGAVADAKVLASVSDGVLYVIEAGKSNQRQTQRLAAQLVGVNDRVIGCILNRVDASTGSRHDYIYHYYGRNQPEPGEGKIA